MRIFPKKAFRFELDKERFDAKPGLIQYMPGKFANTLMFRLAKQAGEIDVIETPAQQRAAENGKRAKAKKNLSNPPTDAGDGPSVPPPDVDPPTGA